MKYLMIIFLSNVVMFSSCKDPNEPYPVKPHKPVMTYTLSQLDKDRTHKFSADKIKAIVSSGNGAFVYAIADESKGLKLFDVDKGLWVEALDDWTKVQDAKKGRTTTDLSSEKVNGFTTYESGILFTLSNNRGLVVLKGAGVANANHYPQGANNFNADGYTPVMVTKNDKSQYIYLFPRKGALDKRILFRTYKEPPVVDNYTAPVWDNSLSKASGTALNTDVLARTQDIDKNLFIADSDGIKRIKEADLGVTNKTLDNGGDPIYEPKDFRLDGQTKNDHINTMAVIDDKILVVGLKSTGLNDGGLATRDLKDKNATWKHFGKGLGLNIDDIAPETIRNREKTKIAAVITVKDKGLLFMDNDGTIMELIADKGHLVTPKLINDNRAETKDYEKASSGFLGDRLPANARAYGAAQDKNGMWYLGFDQGGIYTLDIKTEQVEEPLPPPVLPN